MEESFLKLHCVRGSGRLWLVGLSSIRHVVWARAAGRTLKKGGRGRCRAFLRVRREVINPLTFSSSFVAIFWLILHQATSRACSPFHTPRSSPFVRPSVRPSVLPSVHSLTRRSVGPPIYPSADLSVVHSLIFTVLRSCVDCSVCSATLRNRFARPGGVILVVDADEQF